MAKTNEELLQRMESGIKAAEDTISSGTKSLLKEHEAILTKAASQFEALLEQQAGASRKLREEQEEELHQEHRRQLEQYQQLRDETMGLMKAEMEADAGAGSQDKPGSARAGNGQGQSGEQGQHRRGHCRRGPEMVHLHQGHHRNGDSQFNGCGGINRHPVGPDMRDVGLETPELPEMLTALRDSGLILREGTRLERRKRWQSLDDGLEGALAACASATEEGRRSAEDYLSRTGEALQQARNSMDVVAGSRRQADLTHQDSDLMSRMEELIAELDGQLLIIESVLNRKNDRPSAYNITLFGRTGAGKSTLMEILTNGNGNTIGKGAQRTTQDVRTYEWKGLKVTDVPGVAAFEGEKDAETAHEAAREADLVLFLITDDGPQPAEAKHLARLRSTGRPIIGVCNVKSAVSGEAGKRLFIRDSYRTFDPDRLEEIRRQFDEISDQYNPEQQLPLIHTHLLARFTANRTQPEELSEELREESRFWEVEDAIADEIAGNGRYLRTRSYTDMATEAALETSELMMQSTYVMTQLHERLSARVKELEEWRIAFRKRSDQKLGELLNATTGRLRNQMTPFAEKNWKDRNISQKWNHRNRIHGHRQPPAGGTRTAVPGDGRSPQRNGKRPGD